MGGGMETCFFHEACFQVFPLYLTMGLSEVRKVGTRWMHNSIPHLTSSYS